MRLKKMGHEHPSGESGDLLIKIRLDAEEGRRWEDGRLVQEVQIPFTMMQLGGNVRIMTPTGKRVQIEVPEGTRIGDRRRLQGHGHDGGPLDIEFVLSEPEKLTKAQRAVLKKLRDSGL
jgi:DnaJ-class molecular chaperone